MNLYREVETKENLKDKIKKEAEELFDGEYANATVKTSVCYWRKFNALHKYFADKFGDEGNDNCVNMYMEITDIEELLNMLKDLLSKIKVGDGLINNGYTYETKELDEEVRTERGKIKARDLENGDIIITPKMSGEDKGWVESIRKTDKDVSYQKVYKEKGQVVLNPELCEEMLPTEEGFFFGETNYDEYYVADIKDTIPMLQKVIDQHKELIKKGYKEYDITYYYRAWY